MNNKPSEDVAQVEALGYVSNGHYFVVKGLYYNEKEQRYDSVINETHYKFGEAPWGRYDSDTNTIETLNRERVTDNIGGRDTVVEYSMLYTVYSQSNHGVMYMGKGGSNS